MKDTFDAIVVGLGVGGEEVAGRLADAGMSVLGVERKLVGGECPYWGCIPSKIMVRAATALGGARDVNRLSGSSSVDPDWGPVVERVQETTAHWDDEAAVTRLEGKGASFLRGDARLTARDRVEVDGRSFSAARAVVIATGTEPAVPPIDGLRDVDYWTNREAIEATSLPRSIVILGGGPIGLEFAQTFCRFGAKTTVVELEAHALPLEDPENGDAIGEYLRSEGVDLRTSVSADAVSSSAGGVTIRLSDGSSVEAERVLVATGRRLNVGTLGVEAAGLDPDASTIQTDDHLRSTQGVWAVGDVTGKGGFTHVAVYQGRIAAASILGAKHAPADYSAVPRVTFTDPEVASVGKTQAQAEKEGLAVAIGIAKTASSARGHIHGPGAEQGILKLVADSNQGVLVGASVMAPPAGEILGLLGLAIKEKVPVTALRELIYPYPTFVRGIEDALAQLD